MQKIQQVINYPKGLWLSNSTPAPQGYAAVLTNFLPTPQGLELRKGISQIGTEEYNFICTYNFVSRILLFNNNGVFAYNGILTDKILDTVYNPINFIETNNRVILFFSNTPPVAIYYNGSSYEEEVLSFTQATDEPPIEFLNFSGAVRYKERLFFYKSEQNIVYYANVLAYKGELSTYNLSGIFGTKGKLQYLAVLGYSAGAGVTSTLVAPFDSGDILTMQGLSPNTDWAVTTKISLGTKIYSSYLEVGTGLFILTQEGLVDVQTALKTDNIIQAKAITLSLEEGNIDWSSVELYKFNNFIMLNLKNQLQHYLYNQLTGGFCLIEGYSVNQGVAFNQSFYFLDAAKKLQESFVAKNDNGKQIKASYVTAWNNLGTTSRKKTNFITLDLFQEGGSSTIYCYAASDYKINNLNKASLPKQLIFVTQWANIRANWNLANEAWLGESVNQYFNIKFSRGTLGRTIAVKIEVIAEEVDIFKLGNLSLDAVITNS